MKPVKEYLQDFIIIIIELHIEQLKNALIFQRRVLKKLNMIGNYFYYILLSSGRRYIFYSYDDAKKMCSILNLSTKRIKKKFVDETPKIHNTSL